MKKLFYLFSFMLASSAFAQTTVVDIIVASPDHELLEEAVIQQELVGALSTLPATTVFAPTDAAFGDLLADLNLTKEALFADSALLTQVLLYHVLDSDVPAATAVTLNGQYAPTLNGDSLFVTLNDAGLFIDQAAVTGSDETADNGSVHIINSVLLPQNHIVDVAVSNDFTILTAAVAASGLAPALVDPFAGLTVFAPTDEAFGELLTALDVTAGELLADTNLADILLYHVVAGEVDAMAVVEETFVPTLNGDSVIVSDISAGIFIDQAEVIIPDVPAENGIVHALDAVVLPQNSIVDVAVENEFTILTAAVITAELVPALVDPFAGLTVFAPTDEAFGDLLTELDITAEALLADTNLADILLYHVVAGEVDAMAVVEETFVPTLNGDSVIVSDISAGIFIDQAEVIIPDVPADNGIVHALDAVVLPQNSIVDVAVENEFTILTAAVITAELVPALVDPFAGLTVFAPTDVAFGELLDALDVTAEELLADPDLADILLYHVVAGEVDAMAVVEETFVPTLNGDSVIVSDISAGIFIDQAEVIIPDVPADNGIVHALDAVVLPQNSIVDVAVENEFTILTAAVITAELVPALVDPFAGLTVFAPTDVAFGELLDALDVTAEELLADPDLADILLYHVVAGEVDAMAVVEETFVPTLNGDSVIVSDISAGIFIDQAEVIIPDVPADNGIVHALDAVVLPQNSIVDVAVENEFTILTAAVITAELVPALVDPFAGLTVFAPTDEAFGDLLTELDITAEALLADTNLADILLYHVVAGEVDAMAVVEETFVPTLNGDSVIVSDITAGIFIDQAEVIIPDVPADNGIVHALDAVVLPQNSIVDVAVENEFTILTAAVITAELVPALVDPFADLTVFAPTDVAFGDLLTDLEITAEDLLEDPNLGAILLYHVVDGVVPRMDLTEGPVPTLNTQTVEVSLTGGVFVNDAEVIIEDVDADNGIVHAIDAVLLPDLNATGLTLVEAELNVFPVPATDRVNIEGNFIEAQLISVSGNVVMTSTEAAINVNDIATGHYVLKIFTDKGVICSPVVVD